MDWGVASATYRGESVTGDAFIVRPVTDGVLIAVIDGVGHGADAAIAASRCADAVESAGDLGVISLMRRCHERLRDTRGVVMSLAVVDTGRNRLTWLGVGNVAGHVMRSDPTCVPAREVMLTRGGTIGLRLPMLMASETELTTGDVLILATDGIAPGISGQLAPDAAPQRLADELLLTYGRDTDDALVLVGKYMNGERPQS